MARIQSVAVEFDVQVEFAVSDHQSDVNMMIYASAQEMQKIPKVLLYPAFTLASPVKSIQRDMLNGLGEIIEK